MSFNRRQLLALLAGAAGCSTDERQEPAPTPVPPRYPIGANTAISGWGFFEALDLLAEIGFPVVEVQNLVGTLEPTPGAFPGFVLDQLSEDDKQRIRESLARFDQVTAHLPYGREMNYVAADSEEGAAALERSLDAAAFVGAEIAVLHPQPSGADLAAGRRVAVERIRRWAAMAEDRGFRLACETSVPASADDLLRFHDEINDPRVGVTLDVGHQMSFAELAHIAESDYALEDSIRAYNDLNARLVRELGERLIHLHVHDIEPATWAEHKPLIHGFVDYPQLIAALREVRYAGALVFEIGGDPDAMPGYLREGKRKLEDYMGGDVQARFSLPPGDAARRLRRAS